MRRPASGPLSRRAVTLWQRCSAKPGQVVSRTSVTSARSVSTAIPPPICASGSPGHRIARPATVARASSAAIAVRRRLTPRPALQVAHRVDRRPARARLELQVVAEAVAGAADVADHLALADGGAVRGGEARLVRVARGQAATVLDAGVVPVAADPAHQHHAPGGGRADRRAAPYRDVDPGVQAAPAHAERRDDRTVYGPDEPTAALHHRAAGGRLGRERGLHARLLGLERPQVALERDAAVAHGGKRATLVGPRGGELVA